MTNPQELKDQARTKARELLSQSASFREMDRAEQMALYKDVVDAHYNELAKQHGLFSEESSLATAMVASDMIDASRHNTPGVAQSGQLLGNFVRNVNFPEFVKSLVNGVYEANLKLTKDQMEAYTQLLKEASKSVAEFARQVDDTDALVRLTQNNNQFKLAPRRSRPQPLNPPPGGTTPPAPKPGESDANAPVLVDQRGKPVKMDSPDIQSKLLEAKIALAQERRRLLREMILMGVSRLVVERGIIRASVNFQIESSQSTENMDTASENRQKVKDSSTGRGIFGILFGGTSDVTREITVANSQAASTTTTDTTLSAQMSGFVELQFKSDYFTLNNFKDMYDPGQSPPAGQAQVPGSAAPAQLPATAAPQPAAQPAPSA